MGGMRLDEIRRIVRTSDASAWEPLYAAELFLYGQRLSVVTRGDELLTIEQDGHHSAAVYADDVRLTLQYGLREGDPERMHFDWDVFLHKAFKFYVDVLWNGVVVDRHLLVGVDEGRAYLPLPTPEFDGAIAAGAQASRYWVTEDEHDLARLIHNVARNVESFDSYFAQSRFEVRG
jgi:hypothetical protein